MNHQITSRTAAENIPNKTIKNYVSVYNTKSGKTHIGNEYTNGRVEILVWGLNARYKEIKIA